MRMCIHRIEVPEPSVSWDECLHGQAEHICDDGEKHGRHKDGLGLEVVDLGYRS
jgi:hypothetical protein